MTGSLMLRQIIECMVDSRRTLHLVKSNDDCKPFHLPKLTRTCSIRFTVEL